MLVLSRKPGQDLVFGEGIIVTVLEVNGDRVKLGITAPASVSVLRGELREAVRDANLAAATSAPEGGLSNLLHSLQHVYLALPPVAGTDEKTEVGRLPSLP